MLQSCSSEGPGWVECTQRDWGDEVLATRNGRLDVVALVEQVALLSLVLVPLDLLLLDLFDHSLQFDNLVIPGFGRDLAAGVVNLALNVFMVEIFQSRLCLKEVGDNLALELSEQGSPSAVDFFGERSPGLLTAFLAFFADFKQSTVGVYHFPPESFDLLLAGFVNLRRSKLLVPVDNLLLVTLSSGYSSCSSSGLCLDALITVNVYGSHLNSLCGILHIAVDTFLGIDDFFGGSGLTTSISFEFEFLGVGYAGEQGECNDLLHL